MGIGLLYPQLQDIEPAIKSLFSTPFIVQTCRTPQLNAVSQQNHYYRY